MANKSRINYKSISAFVIIMFLAILARVWWINNIPLEPVFDFETYYKVATNYYEGKGLSYTYEKDGVAYEKPWAFQAYGYPLTMGTFFKIMGNSEVYTAKVLNVILSSISLVFIFFILKKIIKNKKLMWGLFIATAFLPNYIAYNNVLGSEILSVFMFSLLICCTLYIDDIKSSKLRYKALILLGLICGCAAIVKPYFMAYPVILIVTEWMRNKDIKNILLYIVTVLIGFSTILGCSIAKNYKDFGMFIPISYNGGYVSFINNNSLNTKGGWINVAKVPISEKGLKALEEVGYDFYVDAQTEKMQSFQNPKVSPILKKEALNWMNNHPLEFIELGLLRVVNVFFSGANDVSMWCLENIGEFSNSGIRWAKIFLGIAEITVSVLVFAGIVFILMNLKKLFVALVKDSLDKKTSLMCLSILFFVAVFFVLEGQARYNFPTLFLFMATLGMLCDKNLD